jgi:hypothetical protein
MAPPEVSGTLQDSQTMPANTAADSRSDGASPAPKRAWFPPKAEDFEITPEAAMYAGRR